MSKRPTANEPFWFSNDQEVSKAVTQMTDPEYTVEFDGKETYVICNGTEIEQRFFGANEGRPVRRNLMR